MRKQPVHFSFHETSEGDWAECFSSLKRVSHLSISRVDLLHGSTNTVVIFSRLQFLHLISFQTHQPLWFIQLTQHFLAHAWPFTRLTPRLNGGYGEIRRVIRRLCVEQVWGASSPAGASSSLLVSPGHLDVSQNTLKKKKKIHTLGLCYF